jgi:hypothetical protein
MGRYAEKTEVSSDKSRAEIEATLRRYGASAFGYTWSDDGFAQIFFSLNRRKIRLAIRLPDRQSKAITHTPGRGLLRDRDAQEAEYEKAVRQRWRALALVIKAKLEACEAGISTVEDEFLAHTLLPGTNITVMERLGEPLAVSYDTGRPLELTSS